MMERIFDKLEALVDYLPDDTRQKVCSHDFMCDCGRRSCPGFVGSIRTYVRRMRPLE